MLEKEEIIGALIQFEDSRCDNYSLYNGKTGLSITYYLLSTAFNDSYFATKGTRLINEVAENLHSILDVSFENGLTGIGWAIEWIGQNKFIEMNTEEILEDMDDELYKNVIYNQSSQLSHANGYIGQAQYFYKRLIAKNPNVKRYRKLCNQECLLILVDQISRQLLLEIQDWNNEKISYKMQQTNVFSDTLTFLSKINNQNFNTNTSKKLICKLIEFGNQYLTSERFNSKTCVENDIRLIYAMEYAGRALHDKSFSSIAEKVIKKQHTNLMQSCSSRSSEYRFMLSKLFDNILVKKQLKLQYTNIRKSETVFNFIEKIHTDARVATYYCEEGWGL